MKKIIFLLLMIVAMTTSAFSAKKTIPLSTHQNEGFQDLSERDRNPIVLPIAVYYDSDTNILEVWCDNDNIQAEVFVYNESGIVEAYSPYMNAALTLTSSHTYSLRLIGDGWEAVGEI